MHPALFHWKRLEQVVTEVLVQAGARHEHARLVAESLIHADLRGIESHGLARLPIYIQRIEAGLIELNDEPVVWKQDGATALVDGKNHLGAVVGVAALEEAIKLSRQMGIGLVGVRHSNHFGSCSYYAERAITEGKILIVLSNAPEAMAPTGGIRPFFGTNPIAAGIPAGEEPSFLLDMATSVAARGKIALAVKKGESIPADWAIDANGKETTDPTKALLGSLLPIGGAKGYGLAMFIDILCGLLTGAATGPHVKSLYDNWHDPQNVGHLFLTVDIERFMPLPDFCANMDAYIREVKSVPRKEGVSDIFIPGEIESRKKQERMENGIPFDPNLTKELSQLCRTYGVDLQAACYLP
ncbi:Ldh family oxidoreductase [Brevibacillus brevis]|uniref:Ldh family oxidoreductase n=1 Tax=Brevibacillus brevis TaxID=1393 RepID=UPI001F193920|nr:Ldh family oxidoreductase [Brevibacillus brevis]UIO40104.1 Ldh family oxidoreductase [Brevibacillus brevis]